MRTTISKSNPVKSFTRAVNHRYTLPITIVCIAFCLSFVAFFTITKQYWYIDGWLDYAIVFKGFFTRTGNVDLISYMQSYNHSFTPLYSIFIALMDLVVNDIVLSMLVVNILLSVITVWLLSEVCNSFCGGTTQKRIALFFLYFSNITVYIFSLCNNQSTVLVVLMVEAAMLVYLRYLKDNKKIIPLIIVNATILFTREIIWPILLILPVTFFFNGLVRKKTLSRGFIVDFFKLCYFTIILPAQAYLLFIIPLDLVPMIISKQADLVYFNFTRTPLTISLNLIVGFSLTWMYLIKRVRLSLGLHHILFLSWIGIFVASRIIFPGPFWVHYWLPIIPSWYIFCVSITPEPGHPAFHAYRKITAINVVFNICVGILMTAFLETTIKVMFNCFGACA